MTFRMATLALVAVVGAACVGASGASRPLVAIPGKVFVMPSLARDAAGSARTSKPRNGLIVYGSERAVNHVYWLYVMAPNGAQQRSLAGVRGVSAPAVSPDSRWLVFAKDAIRCWPGGAA